MTYCCLDATGGGGDFGRYAWKTSDLPGRATCLEGLGVRRNYVFDHVLKKWVGLSGSIAEWKTSIIESLYNSVAKRR